MLCETLGFTTDMKKFRKDTEFAAQFKGTIGDFSTIIRVAVTGRLNSPDLYTVMNILGKKTTLDRVDAYIRSL